MIYGKIWCVVKPTVGIPLFLGAVAVSSFAVHYMLWPRSRRHRSNKHGTAAHRPETQVSGPCAGHSPVHPSFAQPLNAAGQPPPPITRPRRRNEP